METDDLIGNPTTKGASPITRSKLINNNSSNAFSSDEEENDEMNDSTTATKQESPIQRQRSSKKDDKVTFSSDDEIDISDTEDDSEVDDYTTCDEGSYKGAVSRARMNVVSEEKLSKRLAGLQCDSHNKVNLKNAQDDNHTKSKTDPNEVFEKVENRMLADLKTRRGLENPVTGNGEIIN